MSKKWMVILICVLSFVLFMNLKQSCSNADLRKKIREDKVKVDVRVDKIDKKLKDALALAETRKDAAEKSNAEAEKYKAEAARIPTMSHIEITELREEDIPLQEKYDKLEEDDKKKTEVIVLLNSTIKKKDVVIAGLNLTISGLETSVRESRTEITALKLEIETWDSDYQILLGKKTGWLFFGAFAGWGINAQGEKYPTGGLGLVVKILKINI